MWIVFIIILVIGGLFALGFNIWNYTDNRKKKESKNKKLNLDRSYEQTSRPQTVEETEQTKRIIKQWEEQQERLNKK
jgi:ABC-type bacteriocin/lantibiotic exporter with double-glycine peptidase domain